MPILALEYGLNDLADRLTDFDVLIEKFRFSVVTWLNIIENVRKKDYFKLIEVESFSHVKNEFIRILPSMVLRCLMQNLVRLVSKTIVDEFAV